MSDLRKDPVSGRWVIIAENRAKRPNEFQRVPTRRVDVQCPFCAGSEQDTPNAIASYSLQESTGNQWQVRVVPNKYPAINGDGQSATVPVGIHQTMPSVGEHEVIIESPDHRVSLTDLTNDEMRLVYTVYRDRLRELSKYSHLAYGFIFKNAGPAAGASLEHLHSQLIATPIVPHDVQTELDNSSQFLQNEGSCLFCTIVEQELAIGERIVAETPNFVALCPFASRFSYETWILPRQHASRFETATDDHLTELSQLVQQTVARLESVLDGLAYNWLLHSAPFDRNAYDHYHWHIEIIPRLAEVAGYEFGTGCYVISTAPETAAAILRDSARKGDHKKLEDIPPRKTS